MAKRLSASAPKPRSHFPFPGYPTVAAAGLYLCLSGGCGRGPSPNDPANTAGSNTGGTTSSGGTISTGGATSTGGTTSTGGYLAGGIGPPYEEYPSTGADAEAPLPATPDAAAPDVLEPPSPQDAADLAPVFPDPSGGGGAPMPQ